MDFSFKIVLINDKISCALDQKNISKHPVDDKNTSLRYNLSLFDTTELICFVLRREVWRNTI